MRKTEINNTIKKKGDNRNQFPRFFMIHLLSNLFLDSYIVIRSLYFNNICFISPECVINCPFSTKIFLLFCYFFWRSIFELHIFYMIFFVNNRLKRSLLPNLLLFLMYLILIPFWFLYVSNYIASKWLYIYFDLFFILNGSIIFVPLLFFVYKIPKKLFWERNKFQILFVATLLIYLTFGTYIVYLKQYFFKNVQDGKNYYRIFIASFCVIIETLINFVFSRLYMIFKAKNLIKSNQYLFKILAQGLFGFTNTLQIGTILISSFQEWGLYYQYIFMIYSNINLMSKNTLFEKFMIRCINKKFLKKIFNEKFLNMKQRNLEEPFMIFCSQKISCLFVFIPRLIFLLTFKKICSPIPNIGTKSCSTDLFDGLIDNVEPMILFFIIEILVVIISFYYFKLNKSKLMKKLLFQEVFPILKIFYYMSYHSVYEAWILLFLSSVN